MSWPAVSEGHYVLHPDPITGGIDGNLNMAMDSGALFARKFDLEVRFVALLGCSKCRYHTLSLPMLLPFCCY